MSQERISDELREIEAELASLVPAASGVTRDRLMFLAGQASIRRRPKPVAAWLWPAAMSASLLAAATFGTLRATAGKPVVVERIVYVAAKPPPVKFDFVPSTNSPPSPWENRRLCQLVLEKGIDALPELERPVGRATPEAVPAPLRRDGYRDLFKEFMEESSG